MKTIQIKYNGEIRESTLTEYCDYLIGQIFKLLPLVETSFIKTDLDEIVEIDWETYLDSLIEEIVGANEILLNNYSYLSIINQLEGLKQIEGIYDLKYLESIAEIKKTPQHKLYRKTVLGCISKVKALYPRGE